MLKRFCKEAKMLKEPQLFQLLTTADFSCRLPSWKVRSFYNGFTLRNILNTNSSKTLNWNLAIWVICRDWATETARENEWLCADSLKSGVISKYRMNDLNARECSILSLPNIVISCPGSHCGENRSDHRIILCHMQQQSKMKVNLINPVTQPPNF